MTIDENLSPSPVRVTTPTTMPAQAQVVAALMAPIEPSAMARTSFEALKPSRQMLGPAAESVRPDRKSTRLNSSHTVISYAVFCLKKKKKNNKHFILKKKKKKKT